MKIASVHRFDCFIDFTFCVNVESFVHTDGLFVGVDLIIVITKMTSAFFVTEPFKIKASSSFAPILAVLAVFFARPF